MQTCWNTIDLSRARSWAVLAPLVMLASAGLAHADDVRASIVARNGVLNLATGDVATGDFPDLRATRFRPGQRAVVVLDGPLTPPRRAQLTSLGVRHLGYLPAHSFAADLDAARPDALAALDWVRRVVAYENAWKTSPELAAPDRPDWTDAERRQIESENRRLVSVWLFRGDADDEVRAWAAAPGRQVLSAETIDGGLRLSIVAAADSISLLAPLRTVQWVEEIPEYGLRSNTTVRWMVQTATPAATPFYSRGLTGATEILGLVDGRLGIEHCAFSDPEGDPVGPLHRKILAYNTSFGYELHGNHVGGTAAGDGGAFDNTRGVAYGARIVYHYYPSATETAVFGRFDLHASQGARVHNNSWGRINPFTGYDGTTRAIDSFLYDQEDNLIVFAVANATVISNPENAKNCLAVGAVQLFPNENLPYSNTSSGPTADGRRKPEVMSPGQSVQSPGGSIGCATTALSGTSMATPGISGIGILIREYFTSGFHPSGQPVATDAFTPSGTLLKAMIVNSAVDVTGIAGFPGNREGWGRAIADHAAYFLGDARTLALRDVRNTDPRALETGLTHEFRVSAGSDDHLKITLSWFDRPALAGATYAPVNNLDLEAVSPSGVAYLGNVFAGGISTPGGVPDPLNNLEQVLLAAPEPGEWTIRVRGSGVNEGPQGYALVMTGEVTDQSCVGDFDYSGVTDSDDIVIFFASWDSGDAIADIDHSGGVDSDDVVFFFSAWDGGC